MTIFDADYDGGEVSWAGSAWTAQEVRTGVTKEICPTSFFSSQFAQLGGYPTGCTPGVNCYVASIRLNFKAEWNNSGFHLNRNGVRYSYSNSGGGMQCQLGAAGQGIHMSNVYPNLQDFFGWYGCNLSNTNPSYQQIGVLGPGAPGKPNVNDYQITDNFFGSTTIDGRLYTWVKGSNWP
jgi:hypothetical protein